MSIELFQQIIIDFQNRKKITLTKRDLKLNFIPNMALGIVGVRRCGKTYRTYQFVNELRKIKPSVKSENICRIQFNDHRLIRIPSTELHIIDDAYYSLYPDKRANEDVYFIFDEIHRIQGWEDYILYLLETPTHKVVVTGSTATLLRGEFASQLRGKILPVELYTFSFREFLRHYKIKPDFVSSKGRSFLQNALKKYLKQGGFPGLLDIPETQHVELLRTYWDTMLLRDIIEAHEKENINIAVLRYFADALITRIGCPMTVTKLAVNMKNAGLSFSMETLYKYLSYLSDAFMIDTVEICSESERVRARNYRKVYCIDWALANAVAFGAGTDPTRALENLIYIELKRRVFNVNYYKTKEGYEIDFVVSDNNKNIELIQVAFSLDDDNVKEREIRALISAAKFFNTKNVKIITFNDEKTEHIKNITIEIIPAWKWLTGSKKTA